MKNTLILGILVIVSTTILSACSSTHNSAVNLEHSVLSNIKLEEGKAKSPIYALLSKTENIYSFTQFSTSPTTSENGGVYVNLQTGIPAINVNVEKESDCFVGLVSGHGELTRCSTRDDNIFRSFKPNVAASVGWAVISLGVGATQPFGEVVFDYEEYYKALRNIGFPEKYSSFTSQYDNTIKAYEERLEAKKNKYDDKFIKTKIKVEVDDHSGLFAKKRGPVNSMIKIAPSKFNNIKKFKASSLEEFIDDLNSNILDAESQNDAVGYTAELDCKSLNNITGFNISWHCPSKINISGNQPFHNVKLEVFSKKFINVKPPQVSSESDFIHVNFENNILSIKNKTQRYVSLDSVSYYYNGKIATTSLSGKVLPPISKSEMPFTGEIDNQALTFKNVTLKSASNTYIEFGIALKYSVDDPYKKLTLFNTEKFQLLDII